MAMTYVKKILPGAEGHSEVLFYSSPLLCRQLATSKDLNVLFLAHLIVAMTKKRNKS